MPRKSSEKVPSYDLQEIAKTYPSLKALAGPPTVLGETAWGFAFDVAPEAMEDLISDMIKQAYAKPGRIGQRPMPKEEEVNLDALLHGEYTDEPLHEVLPKMIKISQRAFCTKIHTNRRMFQRLLLPPGDADKYHPDMELLTRIAKAVKVPPSFFLEYRKMAAQAAFIQLMNDRPGVATRLYRDYLSNSRSTPLLKNTGK